MPSLTPAGGGASGAPPRAGFVVTVERGVDLVGRAAAWLTLAVVLLMATDVLLRYAFSIGSVWSQELEWHLLSPIVLFGMTYALQKGDHVRVDVFYARFSPRLQAAIDIVAALLAMAMAFFVIRYAIPYVGQSYGIGEISSDPGGLTHRWMLKALIPIGFALFALQAAAQGVQAWLRFQAAGEAPR